MLRNSNLGTVQLEMPNKIQSTLDLHFNLHNSLWLSWEIAFDSVSRSEGAVNSCLFTTEYEVWGEWKDLTLSAIKHLLCRYSADGSGVQGHNENAQIHLNEKYVVFNLDCQDACTCDALHRIRGEVTSFLKQNGEVTFNYWFNVFF